MPPRPSGNIDNVIAGNAPMPAFVRGRGFVIHRLPDEEGVAEARLLLGAC